MNEDLTFSKVYDFSKVIPLIKDAIIVKWQLHLYQKLV